MLAKFPDTSENSYSDNWDNMFTTSTLDNMIHYSGLEHQFALRNINC